MEWIYDTDYDNSVRYTLGHAHGRRLACFGINPSTATPEKLDPTLQSVERIAKRHGYDGFVMFNVYPLRATDPNDLPEEMHAESHVKNLANIKKFFTQNPHNDVLAAWGTLITKRDYLATCLRDINSAMGECNTNWKHIGPLSKHGHPHHPLYLPSGAVLQEFNMKEYMKN
jgi:hypothetical protein